MKKLLFILIVVLSSCGTSNWEPDNDASIGIVDCNGKMTHVFEDVDIIWVLDGEAYFFDLGTGDKIKLVNMNLIIRYK